MSKINPANKTESKFNIIENKWTPYVILVLFWIIFFRELLTGAAYIFDDFAHQYYPAKTYLAVSLSKGIFPFWNPYSFAGMPFFAHIEIALLYPFNYIMRYFVSGEHLPALAIQLSIIVHYLFLSVFCYWLGKQWKFSNIAALAFSIMMTYSSYMIIHMIHMANIESVTWLPLVIFFWLKFIDTKYYLYLAGACLGAVLFLLAGYPQASFFNYFLVSFYILFIFIKKIKQKDYVSVRYIITGMIIFVAIPIGIAAVQLLPTNEFVSVSNRASFDYEFAKQGSFHWFDFFTVIMPKVFGVWNWNETSTDLQYWARHQEGAFMFSVANIYISVLTVILLIPALKYYLSKKDTKSFYISVLAMIAFIMMFALGGNFFLQKLLFDYVPVFNRFRNPGHILYLYSFCMAFITASGLDILYKDKKSFSDIFNIKYISIGGGFFTLGFILLLGGVFKTGSLLAQSKIYSWVESQYLTFFVLLVIFGGLIYLFLKNKISRNTFSALIILVLCVEIYYIWFDQNNGSKNPEKMYQQNSQAANRLKEELKSEVFRVNMREGGAMIFQRNQGLIDRIPLIEGYGALILDRYIPPEKSDTANPQTHNLMNVKYKINVDKKTGAMSLQPNTGYIPRAKMFYDYKVFNDDESLKNYMTSDAFNYRKTLVLEKEPPAMTKDTTLEGTAKITDYGINKFDVEVETPENGLLYLSEVYYPAWKAYVDGKQTEIYRTDYCMRSVFVEKGKHKVTLAYESDTFETGKKISIISGVIFLAGIGFSVIQYRKKRK